ncbi:MAG TPA: RagB/SusD family nutrient uptake outer membrane protein [Cyclobacteriaceae bacterium]|nr:RagB/SusD family nutrient uptake outer membrane protein [Cyclobacteriaceae bacterium]
MKINIYIISFLLFIGVASCDVELIPETQITDPSFWKSESDVRSATNYLYTFLPGMTTEDVWSDNAYGTQSDPISDGSRLPPSTAADYSDPYRLIRAANNILEKVPPAPVDEEVKAIYIGEARFFRAFAYFQLFQKYGGVPLVTRTLTESDPELTAGAASREDVINQIYEDLDFAIDVLQYPSELGASQYGRISKSSALALKSRVGLFEGTRAKFHAYGNPQLHLNAAIAAARELIESGEHELRDSYFELFQYDGEGPDNKENILVKQYGTSSSNIVLNHNFSLDLYTGKLNPTKSLVDSYLMKDGLPIEQSPMYKTPTVSVEVFENRDERLEASVFKQGEAYNRGATFATPLQYHKTGFGPKKYFNAEDFETRRALLDRVIIRYAEVLLNFAEASYELNEGISDEELDLSINKLRQRAGIPPLSNQFIVSHGLGMQEEIRRERRVELALEGFRYWDLIRWKTAEQELVKPVLGNYFFVEEFGLETPVNTTEEGYIVAQEASFRRFDPNKDYLWPFPVNELGLNPGLVQNPGWK